MDRRSLLQNGLQGSAVVGLTAVAAATAAAQAQPQAGPGKVNRVLFLDKGPLRQSKDRLYDPTSIEKELNSYCGSASTKIEIGFPDNYDGSQVGLTIGDQNMLNGLDHMMATPALIRKMVWAEHNGYAAVISSNTFDPGVEAGRLALKIPVVGLFRTAMHTALTLCDRIAITVPVESHIPYAWRLVRSYGIEHFVGDIRTIDIYGKDVAAHKQEIFDATAALIKKISKDSGAQIVVPLGGALIPYVVNPDDLAKATNVPVLNTKAIAVRFAENCMALGMAQSPICYPHANIPEADFSKRI
jgi:Asp/Glu/hydantoin racemase